MTTRTPTRFFGPAFINAATAADLFTAAHDGVIMYFHVTKPGKTSCIFVVSVGTDAAGTRIYPTTNVLDDLVTPLFTYIPFASGEKFQAYAIGINGASAVNALGLTVTGDYFT